jgi:ribose transport system substrate-binding protein
MNRCTRVLVVTGVALLVLIGASALVSGQPIPVAASHAKRSHLGRTLQGLRMEVIVKTVNSFYWQIVLAGAKKAATQFGVQSLGFTGADSEANVAGQIALMENAIARRPDFIVLAPTVSGQLVPVITKAYRLGIKVIIIDSSANTNNYQAFLATDNRLGGCLAAQTLAAAIKRKTGAARGQIAFSTFFSGASSLMDRDKGFTDCVSKRYPGLDIVAHGDAGGDLSTKPLRIVANTLAAFPHLVGYFADNLITLEGAEQALAVRKVNTKKVSLVGFDNTDLEVHNLKAHKLDGVLLQDPYQMGSGGVAYGILAAAGLSVPKYVNIGVAVATPANVNSPRIQGLLDPTRKRGLGFK